MHAVATGYSVKLSFDHAAMVSSGLSLINDDDVRVFHWDGSGLVELDRVLFDNGLTASAWNQTDTTIMFQTQALIPAGLTDPNYYLFYDDPTAGVPSVATHSSRYYLAEDLTETQTTDTAYAPSSS